MRTKNLIFLSLILFGKVLIAQVTPDNNSTLVDKNSSITLPTFSYNGTDLVNYVRAYDFYKALSQFPADPDFTDAIEDGDIMQTTQYFDGLGRPIQTVARRVLPDGSGDYADMIQFMLYDEYGRQVYQPMAYRSENSLGAMDSDPRTNLMNFMRGGGGQSGHFPDEDIFYGKASYDNSPLNRLVKRTAPGNSWEGSDEGVNNSWRSNTQGTNKDNIRIWVISGSTASTSGTYNDGELMVSITIDEEENEVREFTDKLGRVILKQVQNVQSNPSDGHDDWLNTYYLYDDFNNLRFVLPPKLVDVLSSNWQWNTTHVTNLGFQYTYDGRHRMITKRVPGAGLVEMVYDKLDRLVLTRDANQDEDNQWMFTKYDQLNRPVMTGLINSSQSRSSLQSSLNSWAGSYFVEDEALVTEGVHEVLDGHTLSISHRNTSITKYRTKHQNGEGYIEFLPGFESEPNAEFETEFTTSASYEYTAVQGFHDATFPLLKDFENNYELLTVNYYDHYDYTEAEYNDNLDAGFYTTSGELTDFNFVDPEEHSNAQGLPTMSKTKVLDTESQWLTTVMFYDDRGRIIQTVGENHLGGTDITTTQYDFSGKVLNTYTEHNNPEASGSDAQTKIAKRFTYDTPGTARLSSIGEKLNSAATNGAAAYKTIVSNSYNALGRLETKELGNPSDPIETLDYEYNVRGWMKGINIDELENADHDNPMNNHYFAMELFYDWGFTQNQLNGNIAGVKWKTSSSDQIRAYGFDYDEVNRLKASDYTQGSNWSNSSVDFSTSYTYDVNGNITNLTREGMVAGSMETIDNLTYTYFNSGNSNQLAKVAESNPNGDFGQGDFVDGNTSGTDYAYDDNGNMTQDLNKDIAAGNITYNHLNLPETVTFTGNRSITYTYDAAGIKLAKTVNDSGVVTTTDYVAGFIYENDALQHFAHDEGRTRKKGSSFVYDYFVKDHLGNTRMTLTEARDSTVYDATMETEFASFEESVFLNIPGTRDDTYALQGTYSAQVGPESIGPSKMLVVSAGDTVNLSVQALYPSSFGSTGSGEDTNIAVALASVFGVNGGGATVYEQNTYNLLNSEAGGLGGFLASLDDTGTSDVPKAYLNYVLFDQDFEIVESVSSYQKITAASENSFHSIEVSNLIMPEGGFLYVYLSNEGTTSNGGDVYFDVLRINHKKGPIIQEDHYYPFGLTISALSSSAPLSKPNRYKFNGNEEQTDFDWTVYDFNARFYDASLGRFMGVDLLADILPGINPYNYSYNNPVMFNDPTGLIGEESQFLATCPDCPEDDPKYDPYRESDMEFGYDPELGAYLKGPTVTPSLILNWSIWWEDFDNYMKDDDVSQRYGYNFYVGDGSGGPGSNMNGEILGRIDVTGLPALIRNGKKMGRYQEGGGLKWIKVADGAKLIARIKKAYGLPEEQNEEHVSNLQKILDNIRTHNYRPDGVTQIKYDSGQVMYTRVGVNLYNGNLTYDTFYVDPKRLPFLPDTVPTNTKPAKMKSINLNRNR